MKACIQGRRPSRVVLGEERESGNSLANTLCTCVRSDWTLFDSCEDFSSKRAGTVSKIVFRAFKSDMPLERRTVCLISLFERRFDASWRREAEFDEDARESSFNDRIWAKIAQYSGSSVADGAFGL